AGARLNGRDCNLRGLAPHVVDHERLDELVAELAAGDSFEAAVARHAADPGEPTVPANRAVIDRCFAHDRVEDIVAPREADGRTFAAETLAMLRLMSPTSLKLTLKLMRKGRTASIDD